MPSNLGMAVTTAVFSVAATAWLSSKVFATGVDALVNRMHMRRHAFHSETLMRGGFPPPVARALLHNVPAKDLCREVSSASIAFIHLSDYDAIIDKFSAHPKRLVQTQVRSAAVARSRGSQIGRAAPRVARPPAQLAGGSFKHAVF